MMERGVIIIATMIAPVPLYGDRVTASPYLDCTSFRLRNLRMNLSRLLTPTGCIKFRRFADSHFCHYSASDIPNTVQNQTEPSILYHPRARSPHQCAMNLSISFYSPTRPIRNTDPGSAHPEERRCSHRCPPTRLAATLR